MKMHFSSTELFGVFTDLERYVFWKGAGRQGIAANFASLSPKKNEETALHVEVHDFCLFTGE